MINIYKTWDYYLSRSLMQILRIYLGPMRQLFRKYEFWFAAGFSYGIYLCEDIFDIKGMHDFAVVFLLVATTFLSLKMYLGQQKGN